MRTQHVDNLLPDYVEGRLSENELQDVAVHLNMCTACHAHYRDIRLTIETLKRNPVREPSPAERSIFLANVRRRIEKNKQHSHANMYGIPRLAIPLGLSAVVFFVLLRISGPSDSERLRAAVSGLNEEEVVLAVEETYSAIAPNALQEAEAAGAAEHLQQRQFIRDAVTKHLVSEEMTESEIEGIMPELSSEQVQHVLSGLSEREML